MTITPLDIKARFVELSNYDDSFIQLLIDEADIAISRSWGNFQKLGKLLYVAHFVSLSPMPSSSGANTSSLSASSSNSLVSSKTVGNVSVSYAVTAPKERGDKTDLFGSTSYGKRYLYYFSLIKSGQARLV